MTRKTRKYKLLINELLSTSMSGSGIVTSNIRGGHVRFTTAITASATIEANLLEWRRLNAAITSSGLTVADLETSTFLDVAVAGSGSSTADLTRETSFSSVILASGTVEPTLNAIRTVSAQSTLNLNQIAVGTPQTEYIILQVAGTSVVLPKPLFGDTENLISNMILRKSMNNTTYTYVKSSNSRVLKYTFRLTRMKSLELEGFFSSNNSNKLRLQNWKGEIWDVYLMTNPIDFVQTGRESPTEDRTDVNLEFEGVKLYG